MMIASILTGVPVQIDSHGGLSPAGSQQLYWCKELLKEMGARDSIEKPYLWGEKGATILITKKQTIEHKNTIENHIAKIQTEAVDKYNWENRKRWWQFWK